MNEGTQHTSRMQAAEPEESTDRTCPFGVPGIDDGGGGREGERERRQEHDGHLDVTITHAGCSILPPSSGDTTTLHG